MRSRGFTLIELLVVISIIGLLSSVILSSVNTARTRGKDARRLSDLKQVQLALELYFSENGAYPVTGGWTSQCPGWGGVTASNVIPGLTPAYMSSFPADPDMSTADNTCCYIYYSNGTDYKLLDHNCPAISYTRYPALVDPTRDSGTNTCTVDGTGIWAWAVYTPGACGW